MEGWGCDPLAQGRFSGNGRQMWRVFTHPTVRQGEDDGREMRFSGDLLSRESNQPA